MLAIAWAITVAFILAILPIPAPPLPAKSLIKVKEESEKVRLKLNIQKSKIMASSPFTSWQIDRETMETVTDFIFLGSKSLQIVTAAMKLNDSCSLEEKL